MMKKGEQVNIPVICINDSDRPTEIPISKWLVKDKAYTIKEFVINNVQNRKVGVKLWELDIEDCLPYTNFALNRFANITEEQYLEATDAINKLMEEAFKELELEEVK